MNSTEMNATHGDGRVRINLLMDTSIPWSDKVYVGAMSNGCFEPEALIRGWEIKLYGEGIQTDKLSKPQKEEAARQASLEYAIQNGIFNQLVEMAEKKQDHRLLIDLRVTQHPIDLDSKPNIETHRVPKAFTEGIASGFAADETYEIVAKISDLFYDPETHLKWGYVDEHTQLTGQMPENVRESIVTLLQILEDQVDRSSSIVELRDNFFDAIEHPVMQKYIA